MAFKSKLKIVEDISIGSPCPVESFEKDAKAIDAGWYCNQCSKEVYDLKNMSRKEIAKLIKNKNGNFCAVISRRTDGSLITKEPVSATQSFLSAGILLASTSLISADAIAESERGDVELPPVHNTENYKSVGEVNIPAEQPLPQSSEVSSAPSQNEVHTNISSEAAVPASTPEIHRKAGLVAPESIRGKVKVR